MKVTNEIPCVKSDSFIGNPHPLSCDCSINVTHLTQEKKYRGDTNSVRSLNTHQFCRVGVWRGDQFSSNLV